MQEISPESVVWSLPLAKADRAVWRVHASVLFTGLILAFGGSLAASSPAIVWNWSWTAALLVVWVVSVFLHELGHRLVAQRLHVASREVVFAPWGGYQSPSTVTEPQNDLVLLVAGPLANLAICLLSAILLTILRNDGQGLDGSLAGWNALDSAVERWAMIVFWVNSTLSLVNLIPAYPFDGGRLLRAGLHLVSPQMPYSETLSVVGRFGRVVAVLLALWGFLLYDYQVAGVLPGWLIGLLLGWLVFFASRRAELSRGNEDGDDLPLGYDFSGGEGGPDWNPATARAVVAARPNAFQRWWLRRQSQRDETRRQREADEDLRVDEILHRVHEHGLKSLSSDDQRLLRRVSSRYRRRS